MDKRHFVRYGIPAEQNYLKDYQDTYEGIVINANMLAHISKAISIFVHSDIYKKDFFIDPMTHSFQHELDKISNAKGEIKSSIKKLIDCYGEPLMSIFNETPRPIKSTDIKNIDNFAENVLKFQNEHIRLNLDDDLKEYIEFLEIQKEPILLVAPYFYIQNDIFDKWFEINIRLIKKSLDKKKNFGNKDIYAELVIDRYLLINEEKIKKILDKYSIADGLIYWVDGLDETKASIEELKAIRYIISYYKEKNSNKRKRIISLYGGYFSEMLLKDGLDAVVHGLEYGESREVTPVGGGIPISKYYFPELKKRIPANEMLGLLRDLGVKNVDDFHKKICDCKICKKTIKRDITDFNKFVKSKPTTIQYKSGRVRTIEYPEKESKELCLFHYLEVKKKEFKKITDRSKTKEDLKKEIQGLYNKYSKIMGDEKTIHLKRWMEAMGD